MALIEINIPEEDGWRDDLAGRILLVLLAGMCFGAGFRFWNGVSHTESIVLGICSAVLMAFGTQLLVFATTDIDLEEHGQKLAIATVLLMTALVVVALLATGSEWIKRLSTDVIAFSSYGAELMLAGENPYTASMAPAHDMYSSDMITEYWTWRVDGSLVTSFSYPAGAALAYVPQLAVAGREPIGLRLTSIIATAGLGVVLALMLPGRLALAAPVSMLIGRNLWITAAGGVIESLWLLPFVGALWAWASERWLVAAALLGLAASVKQFAWLTIPFLGIWLFRTRGIGVTSRAVAAGVAVFGLVNAPFIADAPVAWVESVFTPLGGGGAPLEVAGSGVAAIYLAAPFPRTVFSVAVAAVGLGSLAAYWRWLDRLKWAAWVVPPVILLWHSRSLMSYFISFVPVGIVAATAAYDRLAPFPAVRARLATDTEVRA